MLLMRCYGNSPGHCPHLLQVSEHLATAAIIYKKTDTILIKVIRIEQKLMEYYKKKFVTPWHNNNNRIKLLRTELPHLSYIIYKIYF